MQANLTIPSQDDYIQYWLSQEQIPLGEFNIPNGPGTHWQTFFQGVQSDATFTEKVKVFIQAGLNKKIPNMDATSFKVLIVKGENYEKWLKEGGFLNAPDREVQGVPLEETIEKVESLVVIKDVSAPVYANADKQDLVRDLVLQLGSFQKDLIDLDKMENPPVGGPFYEAKVIADKRVNVRRKSMVVSATITQWRKTK